MKSLKDWLDEIQLTGNDTDKRLAIGIIFLVKAKLFFFRMYWRVFLYVHSVTVRFDL